MTIKKGDWVRVRKDATGLTGGSPNSDRYYNNSYPDDRLSPGETLKVLEVERLGNGYYLYYKNAAGILNSVYSGKVEIVQNPFTPVALFGTITLTGTGVGLSMQYLQDPAVHNALAILVEVLAGCCGLTVAWTTIANIAKGFGLVADRHRRIKQERENQAAKSRMEENEARARASKLMMEAQSEANAEDAKRKIALLQARMETEKAREKALVEAVLAATQALPEPPIQARSKPHVLESGDAVRILKGGGSTVVNDRAVQAGEVCIIQSANSDRTLFCLRGGNWIPPDRIEYIGPARIA